MWDELSPPWQACLEQAWEAYLAGSVPIGAAIAGPDGRVLATGRNRLRERRAVGSGAMAGLALAHAEMNALLAFAYTGDPRDCCLYTTTEPCPMCAGALAMANLRQVCYAARDPWAGSSGLFNASPYLRGKHVRVAGPEARGEPGLRLETVLVGLQGEFFLRDAERHSAPVSQPRGEGVLDALRRNSPQGMALAERWFASGALLELARSGAPVRMLLEMGSAPAPTSLPLAQPLAGSLREPQTLAQNPRALSLDELAGLLVREMAG